MPLPQRERLSQGAEVMESELLHDNASGFDCDVLIVGSGYGGAVAAARLAGLRERSTGPCRVWVLERGHEHLPGSFPSRFAELPGKVRIAWPGSDTLVGRAAGLYDLRVGASAAALLGNGLGGGSLINAGVMLKPAEEVFTTGWPKEMTMAALAGAYEQALKALNPQTMDKGRATAKYCLLKRLAAREPPSPLDAPPAQAEPAPPAPPAAEAHGAAPGPVADTADTEPGPVDGPQPGPADGDADGSDPRPAPGPAPTPTVALVPLTINVDTMPRRSAAGVELAACTRCGDCLTGCNVGAKGSLDTSYLAWAHRGGARLFTGATVLWIEGSDHHGWTVHWEHTDRDLRLTQQRHTLRARRVVLSAGSLGSTEILLRSRLRGGLHLPSANPKAQSAAEGKAAAQTPSAPAQHQSMLGERFSLNGDVIIAGVGHTQATRIAADAETDPADDTQRHVGPTITGEIIVPAQGDDATFRLQDFGVPAALRHVLGEVTAWRTLFLAMHPPPLPGTPGGAAPQTWAERLGVADPLAVADRSIDRTSLFGAMGVDAANGAIRLEEPATGPAAQGVNLHLHWDEAGEVPANGQYDFDQPARWLTPRLAEAAPLSSARLLFGLAPKITVHPLGGCAMADDPEHGVVNPLGQVFCDDQGAVHKTLAVLDGAIVPRALGVNPALTIAALAEHALETLVQKDQWDLVRPAASPPAAKAEAEADQGGAVPAERVRRHEIGPAHARWALNERMQGPATLDGQTCWARLEVSFEDVPGWRRALQVEHRVLNVARARLVLHRVPPGFDAFDLDDENPPPVLASAELHGSVRLDHHADAKPLGLAQAAEKTGALTMRYRFAVAAVTGAHRPAALRVGARLEGVKSMALVVPDPAPADNPLRAFTEMAVTLDGQRLGDPWALDLGHLADQGAALLALREASNLPDALDDVGALAFYALRSTLFRLVPELARLADPGVDITDALSERGGIQALRKWVRQEMLGASGSDRTAWRERQRRERWPDATLTVPQPEIHPPEPGVWRLCRYRRESSSPPVVLIHGLGTSGSMFTHPSLGVPLAQWWAGGERCGPARDVWVLDLSSSTANAKAFEGTPDEAPTVQQIAREEIPAALALVCKETGQEKVDVVAHCMGGVMFVLAALADGKLGEHVRSAVISQTSPLVRLSASNRLRAVVASSLIDLFPQLDVADPTADNQGLGSLLMGRLAGLFPYPDDDKFLRRLGKPGPGEPSRNELLAIRQRADVLFGQLFEAEQVSRDGLQSLGALFGPIRLRLLAEALNFVRHDMVTEHDGRNDTLSAERLATQLAFPVLFVHGRRNRVFDWRGSLRSAALMARLRGQGWPSQPTVDTARGAMHWRSTQGQAGGSVALTVFDKHGHLDCMIGEKAHTRVFPVIDEFLDQQPSLARKRVVAAALQEVEWPWLGPMLGWVRTVPGRHAVAVDVVLHPTRRRTATHGVVLVPLTLQDDGEVPDLDRARWLHWPGLNARRWPARSADKPRSPRGAEPDAQAAALTLHLDPVQLRLVGWRFAVLTVHLDMAPRGPRSRAMPRAEVDWVRGGRPLFGPVREAVLQRLAERAQTSDPAPVLTLSQAVLDAADRGVPAQGAMTGLHFALASCQYPSLLPCPAADAAWRRLLDKAQAPDGPQFLLLAGDQVYLDAVSIMCELPGHGAGLSAVPRLDRDYARSFGLPAVREVAARLPLWPLPDDHEVGDHWQGTGPSGTPSEQKVRDALDAYERFQRLLAPDTPMPGAQAQAYGWTACPGGVPLFALDSRTQRTLRNAGNAGSATIAPEAQLKALLDALEAAPSDAVKLVLSSVPLLPPEVLTRGPAAKARRSDTWSGFPASTVYFLRGLQQRKVRRVVLLAGDSHLSSVSSLTLPARDGLEPLHIVSVVSSGLYAPWPFANQRPDEIVTAGPVGWSTRADGAHEVEGRMTLHAMSARCGHAQLLIEAAGAARPSRERRGTGGASLHIRLCAAEGGEVACTVDLDDPEDTPALSPPALATARDRPAKDDVQPADDHQGQVAYASSPLQADASLASPLPRPDNAPARMRFVAAGVAQLYGKPKVQRTVQSMQADVRIELDVLEDGQWLLAPERFSFVAPPGGVVRDARLRADGRATWDTADGAVRMTLPLRLTIEAMGRHHEVDLDLQLDEGSHAVPGLATRLTGAPLRSGAVDLVLAGSGQSGRGLTAVSFAMRLELKLEPAWASA